MPILERLLNQRNDIQPNAFRDELLSGWGRTAQSLGHVITPTSSTTVRDIIKAGHERGIIARGLGRSYGDPAQNAGGAVIDMTSLTAVHDFNITEATITVDAGLSLSQLANLVLPFGFFLPVSPGTQHVTVGGAIACDIHGKNHHIDGSFGEHVRQMTLLTPSGESVDLTPEGSPELFWATVGGVGLTGIIVQATLDLPQVETARFIVDTDRTRDLDEVMNLQREEDERFRYSVAWVDCVARGGSLGRSILMRGNHAALADLERGDVNRALVRKNVPQLPAPPWAPSGLLRSSTVQLLNEAWYRKAPRHERQAVESIDAFFYPLDVLSGWNRFYGAEGFIQYQFVVPDEASETVRIIIERLADGRWPTALAVLKRMGGSRGHMSFALPGWTLAVDMPAGAEGLSALLDEFDELVTASGGRVYLAKDARMRPEVIPHMYPQLREWRAVLENLDPDQRMRSDLARRLQLREVE